MENKGKQYTYKLQRVKRDKPLIMKEGTDDEYVIEYKPLIKSVMSGDAIKCNLSNNAKPGQTLSWRKKRTAKWHHSKQCQKEAKPKRSKRVTSTKPVRRSKRLAAKPIANTN